MLHVEGSFWLPAGKKIRGIFCTEQCKVRFSLVCGLCFFGLFQDGELTQDESGSWRESMLL